MNATPSLRRSIELVNPLWVKGLRARVRMRHLLSWGLVTLTVATFISLIIYTTMTEQELATPAVAAKAVLPGIIVIQAIILMMAGTGAVASGVARERDMGLLDYQRMTPMRPTARIIGYLFGLPMREYVLFLLTLPLLAAAVVISGFSVATLIHFYAIFFTSVLVYHLTALVAGMVSPNPRSASMLSVGMVVLLYFVLPNFSWIGLTFFEFLTIRPTFFGLIQQELPGAAQEVARSRGINRFTDIPFFGAALHPTVYTFCVQGFVMTVMFAIVHRRWRSATCHLLSKSGALLVFAGIAFFLLGSAWAILSQDEACERVFSRLSTAVGVERAPEAVALLLAALTLLLGVVYIGLVAVITPDRTVVLEGWRRARKLGRTTLGYGSDAAGALPAAAGMLAIMIAVGAIVVGLAARADRFFVSAPAPGAALTLVAAVIGCGLFVHGVRERFGMRVFAVGLFLLWMVPCFAMLIMFAAFEAVVHGTTVGLPFPPVTIGLGIAHLLDSAAYGPDRTPRFLPEQLDADGARLAYVGAAGYLVTGLLAQGMALRSRRAMARREAAAPAMHGSAADV